MGSILKQFSFLQIETPRPRAEIGRALFDHFAAESGFDPLVPNNWYNVPPCSVAQYKVFRSLFFFFFFSFLVC